MSRNAFSHSAFVARSANQTGSIPRPVPVDEIRDSDDSPPLGPNTGWTNVRLADIVEDCQAGFASGKKDQPDGVRHLRMNNIGVSANLELDLVRTVPPDLARPQHFLRRGDVLVCTTNSAKLVGKCAYFDLKGQYAFSNHLSRLRPKQGVCDGKFLAWQLWLKWNLGSYSDKCKHWVNQSTLPKDALVATELWLPPIMEQRRIVEKLEEVLAKVITCQQRLATIPTLLARFRQSILSAACSGRLTVDCRQGDPVSSAWTNASLGEICEFIGGSQPAKDHFIYAPRKGYIRFIQIRDYKSDKHLTFIPKSMAKRFCAESDVMIGRYGPPLFQILRGISGSYNVALMKAVPRDPNGLLNDYLFILLQQPTLRNDVIQFSERTVGQDGVRKDLLEAYAVAIPPLDEQKEIVRRVEQLFALADAIEARLTKGTEQVNRLTQAVLAKAFRGELVPTQAELSRRTGQPFETAAELLARIEASQPQEKTKRGRDGSPILRGRRSGKRSS